MALRSVSDSRREAVLPRLRRFLFTLHLVLGLTAGLLLSILGLSGSLLVFRHEIESLAYPALRRVTPPPQAQPEGAFAAASLDQVACAVQRAYPDARIQHFFLADGAGETHEIWLKGAERSRVYVDPYSARILGKQAEADTFTGWLFALHTKLLSGEKGERIVGYGGIGLLVLTVSGVALWWPSHRRQLPDRLRVKWRASAKRRNYDLHRSGGFYAAGGMVILALTGTSLVFSEWFTGAAYQITGSPTPPARPEVTPPPGAAAAAAVQRLPLAALLRAAEAALPGGKLRRVSLPAKDSMPLIVRKRFPGELHPNGMNYLYLDPYTGAVLRVDRAESAVAGQRLLNLRYPVHIGRWGGGLLSRLLHVLLGLMPAALFVTGCLMWWNRVGAKRGRKAASALARERIPTP